MGAGVSALAGAIADPGQYNIDIKKLVARARRETTSTTTTTEIAVMRLDSVPVKAGRHYRICTSPLHLLSTVNTDAITARIRYTTDGSTPTTSSTQMGQLTVTRSQAVSDSASMILEHTPASDQELSLLLTVGRTIGTGNVSMEGGATFPIILWVDDMGPDTGNVGINL